MTKRNRVLADLKSKPINESLITVLEGGFDAWIVTKKKDYYAAFKARQGITKEEIMAAAWHPDRFTRWCFDEEEKAEMRVDWRGFEPNATPAPMNFEALLKDVCIDFEACAKVDEPEMIATQSPHTA